MCPIQHSSMLGKFLGSFVILVIFFTLGNLAVLKMAKISSKENSGNKIHKLSVMVYK